MGNKTLSTPLETQESKQPPLEKPFFVPSLANGQKGFKIEEQSGVMIKISPNPSFSKRGHMEGGLFQRWERQEGYFQRLEKIEGSFARDGKDR